MQQDLLSQLRKEQLNSPHPEEHVFILSRKQEREIIDLCESFFFPTSKIEHLSTLFGCKVKLLD